jgi:hypothetical protein
VTVFGSRACGKCVSRDPATGICAIWGGKRNTGNLPCPDYQERRKGGDKRGDQIGLLDGERPLTSEPS